MASPSQPEAINAFTDLKTVVGKELTVPGTFWEGGSPSDRSKFWNCTVIAHSASREFTNTRGDKVNKEALLLSFPDYVCEDDTDREFWCMARGPDKKTYMKMQSVHDKRVATSIRLGAARRLADNARAEEATARRRGGGENGEFADDEDDVERESTRFVSTMHPFFQVLQGPLPCRSSTNVHASSETSVKFEMKCILPGAEKFKTVWQVTKKKEGIKRPSSTGAMSKFLQTNFNDVYLEFVVNKSPFSRKVVVEGVLLKKRPLREDFETAVTYLRGAVEDMRPVTFGKSKMMKRVFKRLDPRFSVPCRSTSNKMSLSLVEYDRTRKIEYLKEVKAEYMEGCVATTEDGWTDGKGKGHYTSLSASVVARIKVKVEVNVHNLSPADVSNGLATVDNGEKLELKPVFFVLDFKQASSKEKALEVAEGYEDMLHACGLSLSNVCMAALDGAAVGLAAKRFHQYQIESSKTCCPHEISRAVLTALGTGTKQSQNPEGKKQVKKNRQYSTYFHRSTANTMSLMTAQTDLGTAKGRELGASVGACTRWSGDHDTITRNNVLEEALDTVLEAARAKANSKKRKEATAAAPALLITPAPPPQILSPEEEYAAEAALSERYETGSEKGETEAEDDAANEGPGDAPSSAAAPTPASKPSSKVPTPMTSAQWDANAQLEAALRALQKLTLQSEGDMPIADMERVFVKRCIRTLENDELKVPRRRSGVGASRKFDLVQWDDCAPLVNVFRGVVLEELERRLCRRTPCKTVCVMMVLNRHINFAAVLPPAQARAALVFFDTAWQEAATRLRHLLPARSPPSPSKARRGRPATYASDDSDDDSLCMPDEDEDDSSSRATPISAHNSDAEKANFLALKVTDLKEFIVTDGVRGKRLDMFAFFADPRTRQSFPVATLLFESKGAAQVTEAHEERVFRFAKGTKGPLRTRLSPLLLRAYVIIKHNIPVWEMLDGGLDYARLWEIFKKMKNTTGDHEHPGDETSDDDEASDAPDSGAEA